MGKDRAESMDTETTLGTCRDRIAFLAEVFSLGRVDHLSNQARQGVGAILYGINEDMAAALAQLEGEEIALTPSPGG